MAAVQRWLVACVAVDRRHDAALDADRIVEDFGKRRESSWWCKSRSRSSLVCEHVAVVHTVDNGAVNVVAGAEIRTFLAP